MLCIFIDMLFRISLPNFIKIEQLAAELYDIKSIFKMAAIKLEIYSRVWFYSRHSFGKMEIYLCATFQ